MRVGARLSTVFDKILHSGFLGAGVILWFVVILVLVGIVARYFLERPLAWTVEIVGYSLLYMGFLASAWILKKQGHVKMDLVLNRLNPKNQALLNTVTSFLGAITFLVITWYSAKMTLSLFQRGIDVTSMLEPPQGAITIIVPIGSFLLFVEFLRGAFKHIGRWRAG